MTGITLLGHSAVAISNDGPTLVVDPGLFSDLGALAGASAILITHGHADHAAPEALAAATAPIWAPADVIDQLAAAGIDPTRLTPVAPGDRFTAAGHDIAVLGGSHAEIYSGLPPAANNAYLIDGRILHPGDSFAEPGDPAGIELLLLPVAAPWLKLADAINYARGFSNATVVPVHDAILSAPGIQLTDGVLTAILGSEVYQRPADRRIGLS